MNQALESRQQFATQDMLPGMPYGGGYFSGCFQIRGAHFGLVISPRSQGDFEAISWGAYRQTLDANDCSDGRHNTLQLSESGCEIAREIGSLKIHGYRDWYIPARDELELLYRHLKPGRELNLCRPRDGENPGCLPPAYAYTPTSPAQTSLQQFQQDGKNALSTEMYWSSTQASAYAAWAQHCGDGQQYANHKHASARIRAVRRFRLG